MTRLVAQWRASDVLPDRRGRPVQPFARRYTEADIAALVALDRSRRCSSLVWLSARALRRQA